MKNSKKNLVLVFSFMYLVSVYPMNRTRHLKLDSTYFYIKLVSRQIVHVFLKPSFQAQARSFSIKFVNLTSKSFKTCLKEKRNLLYHQIYFRKYLHTVEF